MSQILSPEAARHGNKQWLLREKVEPIGPLGRHSSKSICVKETKSFLLVLKFFILALMICTTLILFDVTTVLRTLTVTFLYMQVLYFTLSSHRSYLEILMPTGGFAFDTINIYTWVLKLILLYKMWVVMNVKEEEKVVKTILFKQMNSWILLTVNGWGKVKLKYSRKNWEDNKNRKKLR